MSHRSRTVVRRLGRSLALIGLLATVAAGIVRGGRRRRRRADGRPAWSTTSWPATSQDGIAQAAATGPRPWSSSSTRPAAASTRRSDITSAFLEARRARHRLGRARAAAARRAPGRSSRSPANLAYMAPGTNIGAASPGRQQRRGHPRHARREGQERRDRQHHVDRRGARPARRLGRRRRSTEAKSYTADRGRRGRRRRRHRRHARRRAGARPTARTVTVGGGTP